MDTPKADLTKVMIPLAEVRAYVAGLMRDGMQEMPLSDFLLAIKIIYLDYRDDEQKSQTLDKR